jgi:hypothetical protein
VPCCKVKEEIEDYGIVRSREQIFKHQHSILVVCSGYFGYIE